MRTKFLKTLKLLLKLNYTAKTNSKRKATFKITKLMKTSKFKATVKSTDIDCYKSVSKNVTITFKKIIYLNNVLSFKLKTIFF